MSDVSTKYSTAPSQNTSLGGLSLEENQTRFRDLNDLFRRIMADAKQESNEVRILISDATSKAADAKAAAETASGTISEIQTSVAQIQSSASAASATAEQAQQAASEAVETANGIADDAANASALAQANATVISSLNDRVVNLEQAATTDATLVQTDGETVVNTNAMLKAIDVQVGEDLASERGQLGRTAVSTDIALDELLADGWYAVGGASASGLPDEITSGVVRVSSGYASNATVQTLIVPGEEVRAFARCTVDGTVWSEWQELVFAGAVGSGLHFENGVLSADFSTVLPETTAEDTGRCLGAEGQWLDVAKPEDIQAVYAALGVVESSVESLRQSIDVVNATIAMGPDNETIMITDGTMSVPLYLGATEEADGRAGLVPPASAGDEEKFLRGDGTYAVPELVIPDYDGTASGLVHPAEEGQEQTMFLRGDGTWADPIAALAETAAELADTLANLESRIAAIEAIVVPQAESEDGEGGTETTEPTESTGDGE